MATPPAEQWRAVQLHSDRIHWSLHQQPAATCSVCYAARGDTDAHPEHEGRARARLDRHRAGERATPLVGGASPMAETMVGKADPLNAARHV